MLPSGLDPGESARFDEATFVATMDVVHRHFPITITDCGAGVATPLMQRVLSGAHSLILATTATADGVLTTESAVDWLQRTGYGELTKHSIVVLTNVSAKRPGMSLEEARRRFASSCAAVLAIPADSHLAVGGRLELERLAPATQAACNQLAAAALGAALSA